MRLDPLEDRLVVQHVDPERTTRGGLILPESAVEQPMEAIVVARGPSAEDVEIGDHVLVGKYDGTAIELDGEKYLIIRIGSVLARVLPS